MSIEYVVDVRENHVHAKLANTLSNEDAIDFEADLIGDDRVQPGFSLLFDASCVRNVQLNHDVVKGLLEMEQVFPDKFVGARRAFVFDRRSDFGWALYFRDRAQGCNFIGFNVEKAQAWLRRARD